MSEISNELQKHIKFNDEYFPRVDVKNRTKYSQLYKFKDKTFIYDKINSVVIYLFKDDEELPALGKDAPWRELDSVGLSAENWNNVESRDEYLAQFVDDLDAEASYYANEFIKNELTTEAVGDTKKGLSVSDLSSNTDKSWFNGLSDEAKKMILLIDTKEIDPDSLVEMIANGLNGDEIYKLFKTQGYIDLDEYEVIQ